MSTSADDLQLSSEKPLAFVLDPVKEREEKKNKGKKRKKSGLNSKNFGSVIDISKFKNASRVLVGWRARRPPGVTKQHNFLEVSNPKNFL